MTKRKLTAVERQAKEDTAALRLRARERAQTALGDAQKIERLGAAIASAVVARGSVTEHDVIQAGFTLEEGKRFYDDALIHARSIEPALSCIPV